jgi:uncharacterized damage-inducible protein DinB
MMQVMCGIAVASAMVMGQPVRAQQPAAAPATLQAALAGDVSMLSDKFVGLARVMAGKYDWKPGQGVRSVGEVFNLIVMENGLLASTLTGAAAGAPPAAINDPTALQNALKASYANLQKVVAGLSDADLRANVQLFGRNTTKQGAIFMVMFDQHEHLGQSIAYARSNGVVPPWSK